MAVLLLLVPGHGREVERGVDNVPEQVAAPEYSAEAFRIPVRTFGVAGKDAVPLFVGVPFPKDWRVGPMHVVDASGTAVPSSARVMARWPESEAIRWMGVDFLGQPGREYFVVPGGGGRKPTMGLRVEGEGGMWRVVTGPAQFELGGKAALLDRAWLDRNADGRFDDAELVLLNAHGDDLYVIDQNGVEGWAGRDAAEGGSWQYETADEERDEGQPLLRAVFRREGWYVSASGERMARHVTRLHFHVGSDVMKIEHRLVLTDNTNARWFREYGVRLRSAFAPERVTVPESDQPDGPVMETALGGGVREVFLFQQKAFYMSRMDREADCHFEIGKVNSAGEAQVLTSGALAGNWMLASGPQAGVGVAVRNFWQTYPKELAATPEGLTVRLWAPRAGEEMDFRRDAVIGRWPKEWFNEEYADKALMARIRRIDTNAAGMSRSHEMVVSLLSATKSATGAMRALAERTQTPAVCLADPRWLRFTEAMGRFHPCDPERFPEAEAFMEEWFDQHMAVWRQWGDYGFFEFGHWPHVWYRQAVKGPLAGRWHPYVDRYTARIDYGFFANAWRSFARGGPRKYFDAAEETTRQRLDMAMVHWDGLKPDEPLQFGRWKGLPERLRGTYTSSNSPIVWAGGSLFHHQSGTDIRALAWLYYLTDHRDAREMIGHYRDSVKRVWNTGNLTPFRNTRPFATLRNLATVYQETGDPELKKIATEQVAWLADLDAPQGVSMEKETTGLGKYGVKAGAMERVYEVLGDELAGKSLLRGAETRALTQMGENPFSYVNVEGEQFAAAWCMTSNPVFARAMRRDMEVAISEYRDAKTGKWRPMWNGVGPSAANNVYPLAGMAYAMDAIVDYENRTGAPPPLTPFLRQPGFGPEVLAVVRKPEGKAITLDVRSNKVLDPRVLDATGKKGDGVMLRPWTAQFHSRTPAATRWEITLPASLPAGSYLMDSGGRGTMWEVTWTDAPGAVMFAPKGFLLGPGGRQWGNRIMPGYGDHNAPAWFLVPEDCAEFRITANLPCHLVLPDGNAQEISGATTVAVPPEQRGKLWQVVSPQVNFIRLDGVPPLVSYGEAARHFMPDDAKDALAHWAAERQKPAAKISGTGPVVTAHSGPEAPDQGILLARNRRLVVSSAGLVDPHEGTLEFWICPQWDSTGEFLTKRQRTLLDGGPWRILLHRFGEMSLTAIVDAAKGSKPPASLETNAGLTLERGVWTHVALQWQQADGVFYWELFMDGKKQTFGDHGTGMSASAAGFLPAAPAAELVFGGNNLDAILAGLRFSRHARYEGDFLPKRSEILRKDADTTAILPLDSDNPAPARIGNP